MINQTGHKVFIEPQRHKGHKEGHKVLLNHKGIKGIKKDIKKDIKFLLNHIRHIRTYKK